MKNPFELFNKEELASAWENRDKERDSFETNYWRNDEFVYVRGPVCRDEDNTGNDVNALKFWDAQGIRHKKRGLLILGSGAEPDFCGDKFILQTLFIKNMIVALERFKYAVFNRQERYKYRAVVPGDIFSVPFARYMARTTGNRMKFIDELDDSCSPALVLYVRDNGAMTHDLLGPHLRELEGRNISYHIFVFACTNHMEEPEVYPDFCGILTGDVSFRDIGNMKFYSLYDYEGALSPPTRSFFRFLNRCDNDFILYCRLIERIRVKHDEVWGFVDIYGHEENSDDEDDVYDAEDLKELHICEIQYFLYVRNRALARPEHRNIFTDRYGRVSRRCTHRFYHVAGNRYYVPVQKDIEVLALPEPDNNLDPFAVALYQDGRKIGYVPRSENKFFITCLARARMSSTTGTVWSVDEKEGRAVVSLKIW